MISFAATTTSPPAILSTTSTVYVPGLTPCKSKEAAHSIWSPVPLGARSTSVPLGRSRTVGPVAAGSWMKVTTTGALEGESGSGTVYQRRWSSIRAATGNAGREEGNTFDAVEVADGVGAVAGVQEPTTSAKVNTCARYLKVR
jgi:hypothetical protein